MFVYVIECENEALYTGYTPDIARRYRQHCVGMGAKYTRAHKPRRLAGCWLILADAADAQRVEYLVKSLSRSEKLDLLGDPHWLDDLAAEVDVCVEALELAQLV